MVEVNLIEIFAGDVPRIDNVAVFPDQAHRPGLVGSMSGATQTCGKHLLAFNLKRTVFDALVKDFKIEQSVLITRRGGGFTIEDGVLPECLRVRFPLDFRPSFRGDSLPQDEAVLQEVGEIKGHQAHIDRGIVGFTAYGVTHTLWGHVRRLNSVLESLEQSVS